MNLSYSKVITTKSGIYIKTYEHPIASGYKRKDRKFFDPLTKAEMIGLTEQQRSGFSLSRTQDKIKYLIEDNITPYSKFVTFTFAKSLRDRTEAIKAFKSFAKAWHRKYGDKLNYLYVLERGKRNTKRLHIHAVLFNDRYITITDMRKLWRYGSARVNAIDHTGNIGLYMVKYITKDTMTLTNKKGYISCKGLKQPRETLYPDPLLIDPSMCDYIKHFTRPLYNNKGEIVGHSNVTLQEIRTLKDIIPHDKEG
jgi:hypothetical protein